MNEELWADVPGFPDYQASSLGRARSRRARNGAPADDWRALAPVIDKNGYPTYRLYRRGFKPKWFAASQLVLLAFVGPPPAGMVARHVNDRDPMNCRLDNLAYGTQSQNCRDKERHGTAQKGNRHPRAKLTAERVAELRRRTGAKSEIVKAAVAEFGVSNATVYLALAGKTWK